MCGFVGIFKLNGGKVSLELLKKLSQKIAHRGPDGEGYYLRDNIGLAHKRLAILDTSEKGNQPMFSRDGNWVLVFNGCIYNFRELRKELEAKGHKFVTKTDTEVIVQGIEDYGLKFIERLNGMFAMAIWSIKDKTLYLCRDRYGIKPLYYWFNQKCLIFASEIKAIIEHPDYHIDINYSAMNEYFTFQNNFTFQTLFKDVYLLPPANLVKIDENSSGVFHFSWWDYDFSNPDEKMSFEEAKEETYRLLHLAVKRQMVSDVPIGAYLSGGMDSGSIVAISSKYVNRLMTFTCGFDMSEVTGVESNYDERRDAEIIANRFKTEHYEQVINASDIRWALPKVVWHIEDLRVGMTYPNFYISRLASKFVKVCLQGTGGDELYGGYPWRYYRVFNSISQKDFFNQYYDFWQRLVKDEDKKKFFNDNVLKKIDLNEPRKIFERVFTFNKNLKYDRPEEHIQNSLYFEIKTFLHGLLVVGDKLSMANGLEERFPFLDNDLVNFAQKIPIKYKLADFEKFKKIDENELKKKKYAYLEYKDGKSVLREAMKSLLPEKIFNKNKQGFSAPDESWYRGENAEYVKEILFNKNTVMSEFINPKYVEKIVREHIEKRINHRLLIWSLLNFEWWCRIFLKKEIWSI